MSTVNQGGNIVEKPQLMVSTSRITSIDLLRGTVMIIMALDHVRDYFHADSLRFDPEDLSQTTPLFFFTRWISHFCAPVFIFLAGTSAFLSGRRKSKKALSLFLLKRGLWLLFLEITVVGFAWSFNIKLPFTGLQ
ncbi:MAG TPA: acyltransferase family protein, partial [Ferruginibacter sp.]|nr:acyltransferase family protein [Ferruginibacter sp.]